MYDKFIIIIIDMDNQLEFYELKIRHILKTSSIFKIRQLDEDRILFGVPDDRCVISMDSNLLEIKEKY